MQRIVDLGGTKRCLGCDEAPCLQAILDLSQSVKELASREGAGQVNSTSSFLRVTVKVRRSRCAFVCRVAAAG